MLLGIPGFPPGMPYGFVRILLFFSFFFFSFFFFSFLFVFFFRRQGFRMITFDRQGGPLQNLNRSQVMVIGRSVSFSDPARPPGGGEGRPKHPKIRPPQTKIVHAIQNPRNIFEKKNLVGTKFSPPPPPPQKKIFVCVLRHQEDVFARKKISVTKNFLSINDHLECSRTIYNHCICITTAQQHAQAGTLATCIYMHTTLVYLGHELLPLLII